MVYRDDTPRARPPRRHDVGVPPVVDAPASRTSDDPDVDVVVIAAGFSGIDVPIAPSRAGIERFVLLERLIRGG